MWFPFIITSHPDDLTMTDSVCIKTLFTNQELSSQTVPGQVSSNYNRTVISTVITEPLPPALYPKSPRGIPLPPPLPQTSRLFYYSDAKDPLVANNNANTTAVITIIGAWKSEES